MDKKWTERDWYWVTGILSLITIGSISLWLNNIDNIGSYFSVFSSAVSVALAFIAIFIAIKQEESSQRINIETTRVFAQMDQKINNMNEKVDKLDISKLADLVNDNVNKAKENFEEKISGSEPMQSEEIKNIFENELNNITKNIKEELFNQINEENNVKWKMSNTYRVKLKREIDRSNIKEFIKKLNNSRFVLNNLDFTTSVALDTVVAFQDEVDFKIRVIAYNAMPAESFIKMYITDLAKSNGFELLEFY